MKRSILLFLLLLVAPGFNALAQDSASLSGHVLDRDGKPIVGATIRIAGTKQGAYAKAPDGRYLIANIKAGAHDIEFSAVGYQKQTHNVQIRVHATTTLDVRLATGGVQGKMVIVSGARAPARPDRAATVRSTSADDLERSARTSLQGAVALAPPGSSQAVAHSPRTDRPQETQIRVRGGRAAGSESGDASFQGAFGAASSAVYPTVAVVSSGPTAEYDEHASRSGNVQGASDTVASGEGYNPIVENRFVAPRAEPFSTFSIDVDAASYTNVRRFISGGQAPPRDAVRIEEMINYFRYEYPNPIDEHPFSITTEMARCPWDPSHRLVRIGLQGRRVDEEAMPPANLVFLIDVSGSMNSEDKLPLLKSALKLLVEKLREEDRVAIVTYAGAAGLVLPSTSGAKKKEIIDAIDRLGAGGSTAGEAGIRRAYQVARANMRPSGNNRVILATDGDFNVGVTSITELVAMIEEERKDGVFLTALGVGTGNYQDATMEQLADHGNGNYYYLDRLDEARRVLVSELAGTLFTIAKDVKIQVEFNPEKVASYRLIGYENRMLTAEDFTDDRKDAGELGAGHSVTALYEIVPGRAADKSGSGIDLSSTRVDGFGGASLGVIPPGLSQDEMMAVRLRYKQPSDSVSRLIHHPVEASDIAIGSASEDMRFAASVAELGLLLRGSSYKGSASIDDVISLARAGRGSDLDGHRGEFLSMVEAYRRTTTIGN